MDRPAKRRTRRTPWNPKGDPGGRRGSRGGRSSGSGLRSRFRRRRRGPVPRGKRASPTVGFHAPETRGSVRKWMRLNRQNSVRSSLPFRQNRSRDQAAQPGRICPSQCAPKPLAVQRRTIFLWRRDFERLDFACWHAPRLANPPLIPAAMATRSRFPAPTQARRPSHGLSRRPLERSKTKWSRSMA